MNLNLIRLLIVSLLAIIFPDTRDYHQLFELEVFWIEHILLVLVPIYFMLTNRYIVLQQTWHMTVACYLIMALYHSLVLAFISILTGYNLNYMLNPPPGRLRTLYCRSMKPCCFCDSDCVQESWRRLVCITGS